MKKITIAFLLTLPIGLFAQQNIVGRYRDYFGSRIELNADSSFKYTWNFDMMASWTKGTWILRGKTIYLQIVPVYDTIRFVSVDNKNVDSLILSTDEIAERLTQQQLAGMLLSSGGQNKMKNPNKLLFRRYRLYIFRNGRLVTKKQKGFWTGKMREPWFFKSND